jgi:hypothetical protein
MPDDGSLYRDYDSILNEYSHAELEAIQLYFNLRECPRSGTQLLTKLQQTLKLDYQKLDDAIAFVGLWNLERARGHTVTAAQMLDVLLREGRCTASVSSRTKLKNWDAAFAKLSEREVGELADYFEVHVRVTRGPLLKQALQREKSDLTPDQLDHAFRNVIRRTDLVPKI